MDILEQINKYLINELAVKAIYDNGGKTADRYTIVFSDKSALGLSDNPESPQGFSQWEPGPVETGKHLGKKILFSQLPKNVQKHAKERIKG